MLVPQHWGGTPSKMPFPELRWIRELSDRVYLDLYAGWPRYDLPRGYDAYLVSFHLEAVDVDWLERQCQRIKAPIVVLHDGNPYDWPVGENLRLMTYYHWHHQLAKMLSWFGAASSISQQYSHTASAVCSRITQSKLLSFTALAEYMGTDRCLLVLSDRLEEKNVHYREPTRNQLLDGLSDIFYRKYYGKIFKFDDYDQSLNYQRHTSDFHNDLYRKSALHFTNESYHHSLMGEHIRPGPFLTEKTLKCLAAGQAFVPVGQFDTYGTLSRLGFEFDYGFDISWDQDPGNITRLESVVRLIMWLSDVDRQDLIDMTKRSNQHNLDHVNSGDFARICDSINQNTIQCVLNIL